MRHLTLTLVLLITSFFLASSLQASSMSQSQLPMSQPNFQGFVPEQRQRGREQDERESDPNLIRLMVHPSLYWVTHSLLDAYQKKHPQAVFRIHQGYPSDLLDLLEDNFNFDILLDGEISEGMAKITSGWAVKTRVFALGRVGLWAPQETVRSTRVLSLRSDNIGLPYEQSPYYRAAKEILERNELLEKYESRLQPMRLGEDLFTQVQQGKIPAAFIEWQRLVEAGLDQRREALKMPRNHHGSITHSATLMHEGQGRDVVMPFWEFLLSSEADQLLKQAGFD